MNIKTRLLSLASIKVEGRLREDLGDIEGLARSILDVGLIQPIVVEERADGTYDLRAGGRRYAALTLLSLNKVSNPNPASFTDVPVAIFNEMPAYQRVKIELEENLRRKGMTWLETAQGIVKYHKAAKRAAILDGETWSQQMTGELLNLSQASVSLAFSVVNAINAGNTKLAEAESLTDAIKQLASADLDQAQAEQMKRIQLKRAELAKTQVGAPITRVAPSIIVSANANQPETVEDKVQFTKEQIAAFYHQGDALEVLPRIAAATTVNHIVCDPPYGINMDYLQAESIERISDTHQVKNNLELIEAFLRISFDCIASDGFLCMWYDLDHHEKIAQWAAKVGWRVQRWPLVWCKTSACINSQAQYNVTKATEVCYFLRKSADSIIKKKQSTNYLLASSASSATHPFCKPAEVWNYCIETVSTEGQVIVDPFAGEGSSLAAIFKAGRNPIGIEIDPKHIASGLSYIQTQLNKKNVLDDFLSTSVL